MVRNHVQFDGLSEEDPKAHIANFLEMFDTFKIIGALEDAIKFLIFPFSLRDKAMSWFKSLPPGSIITWESLAEKLIGRYFPPRHTAKLRNKIFPFQQPEESLHEV